MHVIHIDLRVGKVEVDSLPITVNENGEFNFELNKLNSEIFEFEDRGRYSLIDRVSLYGYTAKVIIEIATGKLASMTLLFDLNKFFKSSLLESKIIEACERSSKVKFVSNYPSFAVLEGWS